MGLLLTQVLLTLAFASVQFVTSDETVQQATPDAPIARASDKQAHYFFNEITGAMQLEDPGNAPYEDEAGNRYWLSADGERLIEEPSRTQWAWIESWSATLNRNFYFNQATRDSQWDRPADLGWRRLQVPSEDELPAA